MYYLPTYLPAYLKVLTVVTVVTVVSSDNNQATSPQKKSRNLFIFCLFIYFYFLSILGKSNLTHLTTNVMFSQRFAILAMFFVEICWLTSVPMFNL